MADLYTSLRDETAAKLITQFGRAAVLRKPTADDYNPATGAATSVPDDTPVRVLEIGLQGLLKGHEGSGLFEQDQVKLWDSAVIMSAKETAAAGIEPEVGDKLLMDGLACRIAWVLPIRPSGIAVIYKIAIARR